MEVKVVSISRNSPTYSALVMAGLNVTTAHLGADGEAYEYLYKLLGGEGEAPPVLSSFKSRGYLPKVYQKDGVPTLAWGLKKLHIGGHLPKVDKDIEMFDSGYNEPHIAFTFEREEGTLEVIHFPIALERDTDQKSFLALARRDEPKAFSQHVMPVREGAGLPTLDTVMNTDADTEVTVVRTIKRAEDWIQAVVQIPGDDTEYVCGVTSQARYALASPIIKEGAKIPAKVRFFKKNFNVYELTLLPEHLTLG